MVLALRSIVLSDLKGGSQTRVGGGGHSATMCRLGKNPGIKTNGMTHVLDDMNFSVSVVKE